MLRTKGFSAIAVIVAGVAAKTNAMESHRTTEKACQEFVRGARPGEHLLPPDTGGGFISRNYSVSQYEERSEACAWRSKPSF